MRCQACNANLTDKECSRRGVYSNTFLDLCDKCYYPIADEVPSFANPRLEDSLPNEEADYEDAYTTQPFEADSDDDAYDN